jgi:hypothetical protein
LAADVRPPETPDAAVELLNGITNELFGEIEDVVVQTDADPEMVEG